jgi:hypothetical protein
MLFDQQQLLRRNLRSLARHVQPVGGLYAYNFETNNWKQILSDPDSYGIDYHMNGAIEPKRKLFIILGASGAPGGGMQVFRIGGSASKITPHVDSSRNPILSSQKPRCDLRFCAGQNRSLAKLREYGLPHG